MRESSGNQVRGSLYARIFPFYARTDKRTFAWLYRNRRLCKDYERQAQSEEAFCYFATTLLMLRRLRPAKAAS